MSDADRVQLSYREEASYGIHPAGTFQKLRFTSESLTHEKQTAASAEIRGDRQVSDLIQTSVRVSGDIGFELSYAAYDALMQYALQAAAWSAESELLAIDGNNAITIVAATGNVSDDAAGGLFTNIAVGAWLLFTNFANAANNVPVKVIAKPDNDNITVAGLAALVDETRAASAVADNARIVELSEIENGTSLKTITVEKDHTDLASTRVSKYLGLAVESMALEVPSDGMISGSFGFLGKQELPPADTGAGAFTDAPTNDVMNSIQHVEGVMLADPVVNASNNACVTSISLQIANNLREQSCVGTLGPNDLGAGKFVVTGSIQAYFEGQAQLGAFLNHGDGALIVLLKDSAGQRYILDIPRVKYSQANHSAGGENQDVMLELNFQAILDPTDNITLRIVRDTAA